ncbi:MAG: histidine kinase [Sphingopyxis sp.]|nr:histidine kinase [Sphingopyxis sp.]
MADKVVLLSGGNPQIPKGDGDAPVQAYIAAMPGWKSPAWARLDRLIERAVPGVRKAVKWNSPLYAAPDAAQSHWFLSIHCFDKYIKVAFFDGKLLDPVPPVASKSGNTRYFHIHEEDVVDEAQFAAWIKQASALPGEKM